MSINMAKRKPPITKKKTSRKIAKKTPTKRAGKRKMSKPAPRVPGAY